MAHNNLLKITFWSPWWSFFLYFWHMWLLVSPCGGSPNLPVVKIETTRMMPLSECQKLRRQRDRRTDRTGKTISHSACIAWWRRGARQNWWIKAVLLSLSFAINCADSEDKDAAGWLHTATVKWRTWLTIVCCAALQRRLTHIVVNKDYVATYRLFGCEQLYDDDHSKTRNSAIAAD